MSPQTDSGSPWCGVPLGPDPGADRGWHRQRLALMPASQGWCRGGIPQAAIAFREPGWWGPAGLADAEQWLPPLPNGLVPVAVGMPRDAGGGTPSAGLRMRVLNPGASRPALVPPGMGDPPTRESVDSEQPVDSKQPVDLKTSQLIQMPQPIAPAALHAMSTEGIVFRPGELVEVVLTPLQEHLDQSS